MRVVQFRRRPAGVNDVVAIDEHTTSVNPMNHDIHEFHFIYLRYLHNQITELYILILVNCRTCAN